MKICLVQKYPPIQGGISRDAYIQSLVLLKAGHEVFVVTNSLEVEQNYRCFDTSYYQDIGLDPKLDGGNKLKVFSTETRKGHFVIPKVNPSVTKLTSLATYVVEKYNCDLIVGFYFEPYGMAAYITSTYTGVPFGIMHGGRDIGQLLASPDLYLSYKKLLERAAFIIGTTTIWGKLNFMGIDIKKLFYHKTADYFSPFFSNTKPPMDLNEYRQIILNHFPNEFVPELYKGLSKKEIKRNIPIIGMYSKSGKFKGIEYILTALSLLKKSGKAFYFVAVFQGEEDELNAILSKVTELNLHHCVWIFPFMPYWHIGHFIRSCTAVCFLEKNFGITFHMPKIQDEVLASSKCLIMSDEIARKQRYRHEIKSGENCFVVNPQDVTDLANILEEVITDQQKVNQIAKNGYQSLYLPFAIKEDVVVDRVNNMYSDIFQYLKLSDEDQLYLKLKKEIQVTYASLFRFDPSCNLNTVSAFCRHIDTDQTFYQLLMAYGDYILKESQHGDQTLAYLDEVIRYCQFKIRSKYNKVDPRFNPVNHIKLIRAPITLDSPISILPDILIEDFKIDIPRLFQNDSESPAIQEGVYSYIFQSAGNYHPIQKELYISTMVRDVLDLCSMNVTPQYILDNFSKDKNVALSEKMLMELLRDLQKELVISVAT